MLGEASYMSVNTVAARSPAGCGPAHVSPWAACFCAWAWRVIATFLCVRFSHVNMCVQETIKGLNMLCIALAPWTRRVRLRVLVGLLQSYTIPPSSHL